MQESYGSHVAGTTDADEWLIGGAPDASIIDIKVLGRNGGSIDNIVVRIRFAPINRACVINISLCGLSQIDI